MKKLTKTRMQTLAKQAHAGMLPELWDAMKNKGCPDWRTNDCSATIDDAEKWMALLVANPTLDDAWILFGASLGEFGRMESPEEFDEFCNQNGFQYTYRSSLEPAASPVV